MAWGQAIQITAKQLLKPILTRLGFAEVGYFARFFAALESLTVVERLLGSITSLRGIATMFITQAKSNPIFGKAWAWIIGFIMAKQDDIWDFISSKASDIWDKHGGDLSNYVIETGGLFITEYIAEATERKTGVALRLRLELPINADTVGEDIGAWLALLANAKIGTNFTSLYPPENLKTEIQNQVIAELTTGGRVLLSEANVQAILTGLQQVRDNQLVQQFGLLASQGLPIPPELQVETKAARRRAQLREAQRNFRLTHRRTYSAWVHV